MAVGVMESQAAPVSFEATLKALLQSIYRDYQNPQLA
jgi:hypothetical protein